MNVLLCIGCNEYSVLGCLHGAEKDATDVFNLLLRDGEEYTCDLSQLLLSPSDAEIRKALYIAFSNGNQIDVLTFFFAGHAGVKAGSFYLCSRESDAERLSTTAFPIIDLFSMVNEFHPKQVNVIVDACQSGGSTFDLHQLLKPEIVGSSDATSITFLGGCSANELAGETVLGGNLTGELVKCLKGELIIQTKWPFLDLIEISGTVSREVQRKFPTQKPITWALDFFGNGKFARNPCFDSDGLEPNFPIGELAGTQAGRQIRLKSSALWDETRAITEEFDARRLINLFGTVFKDAEDKAATVPFIRVLSNTFSAKAHESPDVLAVSQCLGTCASFLLPHIQTEEVKTYAGEVFQDMMDCDTKIWKELIKEIDADEFFLCSRMDAPAELYYLPLRITKILGWIGLGTIIETLMPELANESDAIRFELAKKIVEKYELSLVAVSEAQAPFLYVFLKACLLKGQRELAERVTNLYFCSFAEREGNIARVETDGATAFTYIRTLGPAEYRPTDWRPANPSSLFSVLLLFGEKLELESIWSLRPLDRKFFGFFIPENYLDFNAKIIEHGMNYTNQVGFGIWRLSDFKKEFDRAMIKSFPQNTINLPKEAVALCVVASLLFPDRLPLLLEQMFSE